MASMSFHARLRLAQRRDRQHQMRMAALCLWVAAIALGAVMCSGCFKDSITGPRCSAPVQMADSLTGKIIATVQLCR